MKLWELADLATPWCLHVVGTLRVADHLAAGNLPIATLAAECGVDPESLARVLRHLVSKGVFEEPEPNRFAMNAEARGLLDPMFQLFLDLNGIGGRMAHAWSTMLSAVRTGRPAYHEVHGLEYWDDLVAHPEIAASFDALMGPAGHGYPDPDVLLDPADWDHVHTVVDVGGGTGTLLAELLRARPAVRGTLVDLPRTVERAAATFATAGVADRVTCVGQSFFDPLPAGADIYLLKSVLSDWADEPARVILQRCAEAARPAGRVVLLNGVTSEAQASPELLMMVLVGGKDRTLPEFQQLAAQAGLDVYRSGLQPSGRFIVECRPR